MIIDFAVELLQSKDSSLIFIIFTIFIILLLRKKKDISYKRSFFKKWLIDMRIEKISKHLTYTHT